ncbi:MAG TPA: LysR substrate-binding domain-containing protein [Thermoleophilaceae bacterium]
MELRHLRTIVAVAHHRSLTKAGEQLFLSQSAVSQQIRRLEEELGVEVFRRTSRSVGLTPAGQVILGYANRVLAEVDGMHSELEEISGLLSGELRIGGVYPTGPFDLFGLLAEFRVAHPGVAIHMTESTQDDVVAALRADELDCAFAALDPRALGDEFAATLLWEEEIVVALPTDHPCCSRERITFEELAAEDLIAYRDNSALRRRLGEDDGRARARTPQRVRVHGDGGCASPGEQGPGGGGDAPLGGRAPRASDRVAGDRPRSADLADRAGLARGASPDAGRQGLHRGRPRLCKAHRAPGAPGGLTPRTSRASAASTGW